jgi:prevent-host-death family protein
MFNMSSRRVGMRELRQHLRAYLGRVEEGETFEVTERGRAVAVLGPLPRRSVLDELAAEGQAILASRDPRTLVLPEPVPLRMSATEALEQLRADER